MSDRESRTPAIRSPQEDERGQTPLRATQAQAPRASARRRWAELIGFPLVAVSAALWLHLGTAKVYDFDGLWHLAQARAYVSRGLWYGEFPWLVASAAGQTGGDDWYGFHLLLIPFTLIPDPEWQVRIAGICLTASALLILWWALRLMQVQAAWLWPFLIALGSTAAAPRYAMVRPQTLSNVLPLLALPLLLRGAPWKAALLGFCFTWIHFNVFWMLLVVAAALMLVRWLTTRRLEWRRPLAMLGGMVAGWSLRPDPLGAAWLAYLQTFGAKLAKARGVSIEASGEMLPMSFQDVRSYLLVLVLVWSVGVLLWMVGRTWRREQPPEPQRTWVWTSLGLSAAFLALACVFFRATDQWAVFGFAFVGLAVTTWAQSPRWQELRRRPAVLWAVGMIAVILTGWLAAGNIRASQVTNDQFMPDMTRMRGAGEWLEEHAPAGAIVFSPHWDYFPELFFWNPQGRYIGGILPALQYAFSPDLYWKTAHIAEGNGTLTCGEPRCTPDNAEDPYTVLKRDFHARYVILSQTRDWRLVLTVRRDSRYRLCYEDLHFVVLELDE